jgi:hypothetical protein
MEEIVTTKRGSFGFIRVTIPMNVKDTMLLWHQKSGMRRAEFFRVSLMIGANHLAESINAKDKGEGYDLNLERRFNDGLPY